MYKFIDECIFKMQLGKVMKVFDELETYVRGRIQEHRLTFDPNNIRDFVDLFLKHERSEDGAITGFI